MAGEALRVEEEASARGAFAFAAVKARAAFDQTAGEGGFLGFGRHGDAEIPMCGPLLQMAQQGVRKRPFAEVTEAWTAAASPKQWRKGMKQTTEGSLPAGRAFSRSKGSFSRDLEAD